MKIQNQTIFCSLFSAISILSLCSDASALTYTNANLDAMLCFRKLSAPNPFDLEVNIGSITNYTSLPIGSNVTIGKYTVAQLTNAMGNPTFENVEFSVTAAASEGEPANFPFAIDTLWVTRSRTTPSTQSTPFARASDSSLGNSGAKIDSLGNQAAGYSTPRSADPLVNTATAVAIAPGNTTQSCENYIGPGNNSKLGGTFSVAVENRAPSPFTSAIVSDLYVDVPIGSPDPLNTNATSGNVSYLGYFTFNPDGTMTFTRAVTTPALPPKPTLTVTRNGITNIISFPTANNATYTLFFTNSAGLSVPMTNWPSLPSIIGNGQVNQITNTATDSERYYRARVHN